VRIRKILNRRTTIYYLLEPIKVTRLSGRGKGPVDIMTDAIQVVTAEGRVTLCQVWDENASPPDKKWVRLTDSEEARILRELGERR
jgi:hypothetical protein